MGNARMGNVEPGEILRGRSTNEIRGLLGRVLLDGGLTASKAAKVMSRSRSAFYLDLKKAYPSTLPVSPSGMREGGR